MDAIVQAILNLSKLEVSHIKITKPTQKDFIMEIQSRVTGTGPIGATMTPMTVDLVGPGGAFGKLDLPEVKTSSKGTDVHIDPQKIDITDFEAFRAFVKSITQDEKLTLRLENGKGKIKALGMNANITYKKPVELAGMNGPKARIVKAEGSKDDLKIQLQIFNPSPLEIDLGTAIYDMQGEDGAKVAEIRGPQHVVRGDNSHEMTGKITGSAAAGAASLVGTGSEGDSWTKETNKYLNMKVQIPETMATM